MILDDVFLRLKSYNCSLLFEVAKNLVIAVNHCVRRPFVKSYIIAFFLDSKYWTGGEHGQGLTKLASTILFFYSLKKKE